MTNPAEKERLQLKLEIGHESETLAVGPDPPAGTHTHKWTIFLRPASPNACLDETVLQKVIFQLHEDFPNHKRSMYLPIYYLFRTFRSVSIVWL